MFQLIYLRGPGWLDLRNFEILNGISTSDRPVSYYLQEGNGIFTDSTNCIGLEILFNMQEVKLGEEAYYLSNAKVYCGAINFSLNLVISFNKKIPAFDLQISGSSNNSNSRFDVKRIKIFNIQKELPNEIVTNGGKIYQEKNQIVFEFERDSLSLQNDHQDIRLIKY